MPTVLEIELGSPHPIFLGGEGRYEYARVLCVFTLAHRWGKVGVPASQITLHTFALVLVLVQWWGSRDPAAHTQSCKWEASLQIHVYSHTCVHRPKALPSLPSSSEASHVIFPLLSTVMELPVLLERLPNTLIGTPAMIKKKFQIRAAMP